MRISTGVPGLDEQLGGGLLPGTLTVALGATGIGKSQLGVQFAHGSQAPRGVIFDVCARGDAQSHQQYAQRMHHWTLTEPDGSAPLDWARVFDVEQPWGNYLHVFDYQGRRVTRQDLDWDQWHQWQAELNQKLQRTIAFFYANFLRGVTRVVVDGVEPAERPGQSIQLNLFEYVYHQILRKDPEWVARDLLRESYRAHAEQVARHQYAGEQVTCLLSLTSREMTLDDLIVRPLDEGDALVNANTVLLMGKFRDGSRMRRGIYVAKHRGSACTEEILPYTIDDQGLAIGG